jgi:alpha-L-rhamnosidase
VLGVRPIEPGFAKVLIRPQPCSLRHVSGTVPTIRGPIDISIENDPEHPYVLKVDIPANMKAKVGLPRRDKDVRSLVVDGKKVEAELECDYLLYDDLGHGTHVVTFDS